MRTTLTRAYLFAVIIFSSCNQGIELKPKTNAYFILDQIQKSVRSEYFNGREDYDVVKETALDKSEPGRATRVIVLLKNLDSINKAVGDFLRVLRTIKLEMVSGKQEVKRMFTETRLTPDRPFSFQLDKIRILPVAQTHTKTNQIRKDFITLRRKLIKKMTSLESGDISVGNYFFKDPNIVEFSTEKQMVQAIEKAISLSNVAQDDKESLIKIYSEMTKSIFEFPEVSSNSMEFFTSLTALEYSVMSARTAAFRLLKARIGCCGCYSFNKIVPYVECPSVAQVGDTILVWGMMAAYDSDKHSIIRANGVDFKTHKGGVASHHFVVPNRKEFLIKGNMTILNKSGVAKTMPFKRNVKILQKE